MADIIPLPQRLTRRDLPGNGALEIVRHYFSHIHPARRHGKTDCGAYLDGTDDLPDGDHFLAHMAAAGYLVLRADL